MQLYLLSSETQLLQHHGGPHTLVSGDLWPLAKTMQMLRRVNHSQAFHESFYHAPGFFVPQGLDKECFNAWYVGPSEDFHIGDTILPLYP